MGRYYYAVAGVAFLSVYGWLIPAAAKERPLRGSIVRHIDGDTTVVATEDGRALKIRLLGIDAPETAHGRKKEGCQGQPFGEKALAALNRRAPAGSTVAVTVKGRDRYGRALGTIFEEDENVNLWMVRNGWAEAYGGGRGAEPYRVAEKEAKSKGAGIWTTGEEPPREYRGRCR